MSPFVKPIENVIFEVILKVSLLTVLLVSITNLYLSGLIITPLVQIDFALLFAVVPAIILYKKDQYAIAVVWLGCIIIGLMFYQTITADRLTTSSIATVMAVGFMFSVSLKHRLPFILHGITLVGIGVVYTWLGLHPHHYGMPNASYIISTGISYCVLYFFIVYTSLLMKQRYDSALALLAISNNELIEKTHEIEAQNEELRQTQENLFQLNNHLESMVEDRTKEIKHKNELLTQYAYSNAHKVRGPVARVLGLIQLSKLDTNLDYTFLFKKIEEQTLEIDIAVKGINTTLAS